MHKSSRARDELCVNGYYGNIYSPSFIEVTRRTIVWYFDSPKNTFQIAPYELKLRFCAQILFNLKCFGKQPCMQHSKIYFSE
jgi:hypothetical protein